MFKINRSRLQGRGPLFALSVLGVATGMADPALAGSARDGAAPPHMTLGTAALPPIGFLDFCARSPDDCLQASGEAADVAALRRAAMQGFWQAAFSRSPSMAPQARPAALGTPPVGGFGRATRYDWSRVFTPNDTLSARLAANATVNGGPIDPPSGLRSGLRNASNDVAAPLGRLRPLGRSADGGSPPSGGGAEQASGDALAIAKLPTQLRKAVAGLPPRPLQPQPQPQPEATPTAVGAGSPASVPEPDGSTFSLDRAGMRLVNTINRRVNRQIRRADDARTYGVADYWAVPRGDGARGDCEDFVLAKRRALIEAGVPAGALSIAIVDTQWGESHAVLLISAEQGEFVLDSLTPWISRWDRVNYVWRERQLPGRPFDWVRAGV